MHVFSVPDALCPGYIPTDLTAEWLETPPGQNFLNSFPRPKADVIDDGQIL